MFMLVGVAACRSDAGPDVALTTVDSAGIAITTITSTIASVPAWEVDTRARVTLESPDSTGFVYVSAAHWVSAGRLLVADARQRRLYLYDSAGRHLRTIGRDGSGPGEFRGMMTVSVVGDTIGVWDLSGRRFSLFTVDSGFRLLVPTPKAPTEYDTPRETWITGGVRPLAFWLRGEYPGPVPQGVRIRRWQFTGQLAVSDTSGRALAMSPTFNGVYTGQSDRGDARQLFSNAPFVAVAELIAYGSGEAFEVRVADRDLRTRRIVRWSLADEPLTEAEVASARARLLASMPPGAPRERIEAAVNDIVAPELLPKTRPAISRALWDHGGQLWLGRFEAPVRGLAEAFDWIVLDSAARPVGRVRLPDTARIESVRGSELLLSVRDSLDVQTVQVWRVKRAAD
ncbi:MAG: 6-bladed beta-propeller [Gemmatimonadaceae bacterium]